jgi:hypothetical protein
MFGYDKISLNISESWLILILLLILSLIFSIYSYRFTLPPISNIKKIILISLRFLALAFLISIFFEPVLSLQKKINLQPTHLIFIDNSKSISAVKDSEKPNEIINRFSSAEFYEAFNNRFFTFGSNIKELKSLNSEAIKFDESSTNFSRIFRLQDFLENYQSINPSSITILSDGIINDGNNPIYQAEKLGLPVFTFAVGDSSRKKDILVKNVIHNENIYLGVSTTISTSIQNVGFENVNAKVSLIEDGKLLDNQTITLNSSGLNVVNFNYVPKEIGERKLQIKVDALSNESNVINNVYPFFVKVTEDKTKVLVISGSPSADFTFIKRILETEETFRVSSLTQVESNFLESNFKTRLDSANVLFLIGFPNQFTSAEIFNDIKNKIVNKKTPFFLIMNNDVSLNKIKQLEGELPFRIDNNSDNYIKAQPDLNFNEIERFDLLNNISENDWNKIPPILYPPNLVSAKPESRVISYIKADNNRIKFPMIIQRGLASSRSIALIGKEFWRWKLQTSDAINVLDNLILNSAKWLSIKEDDRQFRIKTLKNFYSASEEIEFVAELYNELLNPINDGEIKVNVKGKEDSKDLLLTSLGNGLYEGKLFFNKAGDYSFSATAKVNNKIIGSSSGRFNIGDVDLEMIDLRMNYELLSDLSKRTNGEIFSLNEFDKYLKRIGELDKRASTVKISESQIKFQSNEIILIIVIILFSIEWLIRKQSSLV